MPNLIFEPDTFEGHTTLERSIPEFEPYSVEVVQVNGSYPFGHVLLLINRQFFFHVTGLNEYPKFLTSQGWKQYVQENGKQIVKIEAVEVPHPNRMINELKKLMSEPWNFRTNHNCVNFVQEVLAAGGAKWELITGIPTIGKIEFPPKFNGGML